MTAEKHQARPAPPPEQDQPLKPIPTKGLRWEKPELEDVSGRVMAQPYIRFT